MTTLDRFLVACTRLYKTLCRSVGRLVGLSVRYIYFRSWISLFRGLQRLITAPAQPHATKIAVYTALFSLSLSLSLSFITLSHIYPCRRTLFHYVIVDYSLSSSAIALYQPWALECPPSASRPDQLSSGRDFPSTNSFKICIETISVKHWPRIIFAFSVFQLKDYIYLLFLDGFWLDTWYQLQPGRNCSFLNIRSPISKNYKSSSPPGKR